MSQTLRLVTFRLGDDLFATEIGAVERVLRYESPRVVPNLPDWVSGVIEYAGRILPVLDLARRFALPNVATGGKMRLLVLSAGGELAAVVVDGVLDVRNVSAAELSPPPPLLRSLAAAFLRGVMRRDDQLVLVLDSDRLLSASERQVLASAVHGDEYTA
ncbi:MAG: chemotaxis protein CheW [Gemmatimonadaceae bacterium]